jgi:hypothetical protein
VLKEDIVTEIDFAYFNYEHGGLVDGRDHFFSSGRGYDYGGLVRVAGSGGPWVAVQQASGGGRRNTRAPFCAGPVDIA